MDRNKTRTNQPSNGLNPFTYDNAFAHGKIKKVDNQRDFSEIIFIFQYSRYVRVLPRLWYILQGLHVNRKRIFLSKFSSMVLTFETGPAIHFYFLKWILLFPNTLFQETAIAS